MRKVWFTDWYDRIVFNDLMIKIGRYNVWEFFNKDEKFFENLENILVFCFKDCRRYIVCWEKSGYCYFLVSVFSGISDCCKFFWCCDNV